MGSVGVCSVAEKPHMDKTKAAASSRMRDLFISTLAFGLVYFHYNTKEVNWQHEGGGNEKTEGLPFSFMELAALRFLYTLYKVAALFSIE